MSETIQVCASCGLVYLPQAGISFRPICQCGGHIGQFRQARDAVVIDELTSPSRQNITVGELVNDVASRALKQIAAERKTPWYKRLFA